MKFCTKCGAELFDDAVICTKCGRMLEAAPTPLTPQGPSKLEIPSGESPVWLLAVSNFFHSITTVLSLIFALLSFDSAYVQAHLTPSELAYGVRYAENMDVYTHYGTDEDFLIFAVIFAGVALVAGTLSLIMTLVKKRKGEALFAGISKAVVGLLVLAASIVMIATH